MCGFVATDGGASFYIASFLPTGVSLRLILQGHTTPYEREVMAANNKPTRISSLDAKGLFNYIHKKILEEGGKEMTYNYDREIEIERELAETPHYCSECGEYFDELHDDGMCAVCYRRHWTE